MHKNARHALFRFAYSKHPSNCLIIRKTRKAMLPGQNLYYYLLPFFRIETIPAVNGTVIAWFERNLGCHAAFSTNGIIHFARRRSGNATFTAAFSGIAALTAANRIILEPFLSIKLLFAGCEDKVSSTVLTFQCSVLKCHYKNPLTLLKIRTIA